MSEVLLPRGDTVIRPGDGIVVSALSHEDDRQVGLSERVLDKNDEWVGKTLGELKLGERKLVVLIRRGPQVLIPNGRTDLREQDTLVMIET